MPRDTNSFFAIRAADKLAVEVATWVKEGKLDARCTLADLVLEYASTRFGDQDPIGDLLRHSENKNRPGE